MHDTQPGVLKRLWGRTRRIPPVLLVVIAAALTAVVVGAVVALYRTYDYVQHDNDFCLSCHLMVDPYERFSRSAHRDLGCKACHRPTLVTRSTMALTQILENPDSLEAHAEVPNAVCIECHVDGNPDEWRNVAASAGHRVHLESEDPALSGLQCVQCHSSSVHEFTATDQTCGQAGCHEAQRIVLGEMGNLTIHCATCHDFNAQVVSEAPDSVQLALQPQHEECLSCHAMRERLVDFPLAANDPHDGLCGTCHNPHEQTTPRAAFESCGAAGCHARADTLTPFHRGLDDGVVPPDRPAPGIVIRSARAREDRREPWRPARLWQDGRMLVGPRLPLETVPLIRLAVERTTRLGCWPSRADRVGRAHP